MNPTTSDRDSRFKHMLDGFRNFDAVYFHKVMKKSMLAMTEPFSYQVEFPYPFSKSHGDKFSESVTFERQLNNVYRKWPMAITVKNSPSARKCRVFIYSKGGWKDFAVDNNLKVGDLVIFNLISYSRFVIYICRKELPVAMRPVVHTDRNEMIQRPLTESADCTRNESRCQETRCDECGQTSPSPQFVATVSVPHLNVSTRFWLRHRELLPSNVIELEGPSKAVVKVEVKKYVENMQQITYRLESGWAEFAGANLLDIGDALLFCMVGECRFKVEVMDAN